MIIKTFPTGVLQVNTYLLIDEKSKEAVIIDLGGDFEKLNDEIKKHDAKLKFVLNTHGHFDHIMGDVSVLEGENKVPIYMHKSDLPLSDNIEDSLKKWGIAASFPKIKIENFVDESSDLAIGGHKITVIHTPGHTLGGVCYLIDNDLFAGDTLFYNSIGRTDLEGGNYQTLISSIKDKLFKLNDEVKVYPGHGPATTIAFEKQNNPYLK